MALTIPAGKISFRQEHDIVVLSINGAELRFSYKDALTMAGAFRLYGRRAKIAAGDLSPIMNTFALLKDHDENVSELIKPNLQYTPLEELQEVMGKNWKP